MSKESPKREWFLLVLLILVLAFAFQGSRGLWRPDEGRYVRCAYEMLKTDEWVTPQLGYKPHFTKPPLTYWLIALGLELFGINEWGARFFHAVAFALTAVVVGLLGTRMWGKRQGIGASFIYATSLTPFIAANVVTTDTILTCFETMAMAGFWMSMTERDNPLRRFLWTLMMWLSFGLAFLTKGPPGLVPLAVIIIYLFAAKNVKRPSPLFTLAGIAVFAGVALPWYVIAISRHDGLFSYLLLHEFVGRILTGEQNRNPNWFGPIQAYLPVLTIGALPWAVFWPALLKRARPAVLTASWWKKLRSRPKALFLLLWFFLPLVVFCISSSRLSLYVLPVFAPLALFSACEITKHFPEIVSKAYELKGKPALALGIITLLLLTTKFAIAHVTNDRDTRALWYGIRGTIQEKVGNAPYEIVSVHANYDGLEFYSGGNVECLGSGRETSSYIPPESIEEEYEELLSAEYKHIFLASEKYEKEIVTELKKRGIPYSIAGAPFGRILVICEGASSQSVTSLAIMGDAGTGNSSQTLLGSALYHIDQHLSLAGILLAGDNLMRWDGAGSIENALKKYFEKPYWPLLSNKVPFYAALGNHDLKHTDYEIQYPLFHMQGRRYYSELFGPNRVEAFFLDSNTISEEPAQVEWLERSLENSTAIWKVVVMHYPMYSTAKKRGTSMSLVKLLEPIFVRNGVDLVVYGHNHLYERLRPINGIQYMTVGSSGKLDFHGLAADAPDRVYGNDEENVALVLQFYDDRCHFTAYTVNEKVLDEGEIARASVLRLKDVQAGAQTQALKLPEPRAGFR